MNYKVVKTAEGEYTVLVENGGVASIRYVHEDDRVATTDYYQSRITDEKTWDEVWENLAEGKMYHNDWKVGNADLGELVEDALNWLVVGETNWVKDPTIFAHLV